MGARFSRSYTVGTYTEPRCRLPAHASPAPMSRRRRSVTASSQNTASGQTAVKAVDGVIAGYPVDTTREWATVGGKAGSYLNLAFPTAVTLNRVVLYDRPNSSDQITGGTLTFSDGTTVPVPALDNAGKATTRQLHRPRHHQPAPRPLPPSAAPPKTSASPNSRHTSSTNVAASASVTASSQNASHRPDRSEGRRRRHRRPPGRRHPGMGHRRRQSREATSTSPSPPPLTLNRVVLYDRPNSSDQITGGTLTFSDGTTVPVPALDNAGKATTVSFPARATTSLRLTVTTVSGTTRNVGLAELQAYRVRSPAPTSRRPRQSQRAPRTHATGQTAVKAVDGVIAGHPVDATREWATVGGKAGSYLNLAFPTAVTLNRVVLYDRPNSSDQITGGTLTFSDGTTVPVPALDNAGKATTVSFTDRATTSLRLTVTTVSGTTLNIGLAELQAYTN